MREFQLLNLNNENHENINWNRYRHNLSIEDFIKKASVRIIRRKINQIKNESFFTINTILSRYPYSTYANLSLSSMMSLYGNNSQDINRLNKKTLVLSIEHNKNYGHILFEALPILLYFSDLDKKYTNIVTCETDLLINIIKDLGINLSDKIKFVKNDYKFICEDVTFLYTSPGNGSIRDFKLIKNFKNKIDSINTENFIKNKIIYCARSTKAARHGRRMNEKNEKEIIEILENFCICNAQYELVIFDSLNENGITLTARQQFELFQSAKIIIGPHGTAMYNSVFAKDKVIICEFTGGFDGINGDSSFKNFDRTVYYDFYGIKDKIDYYCIPYSSNSHIHDSTIDTKNLEHFLSLIR